MKNKSPHHKFEGNWKDYLKSQNVIYLIENKLNGKSYIGMTNKLNIRIATYSSIISRAKLGKNQNWPINLALRKYGPDNFKFNVIQICDSYDELGEVEIEWIRYLRTQNIELYNIADGGSKFGCQIKSGTELSFSKLNIKDIQNIFEMYYEEKKSITDIRKLIGFTNVNKILKGEAYYNETLPFILKYGIHIRENNKSYTDKICGANHSNSKFDKNQISNIFEEYYINKLNLFEISNKFKCSKIVISRILRGSSYKNDSIELIKLYGIPKKIVNFKQIYHGKLREIKK